MMSKRDDNVTETSRSVGGSEMDDPNALLAPECPDTWKPTHPIPRRGPSVSLIRSNVTRSVVSIFESQFSHVYLSCYDISLRGFSLSRAFFCFPFLLLLYRLRSDVRSVKIQWKITGRKWSAISDIQTDSFGLTLSFVVLKMKLRHQITQRAPQICE